MKNVLVKYYILINRGQAFKTSHALFSVMVKPFTLLIYTKVTTRSIIQSLRTFQLCLYFYENVAHTMQFILFFFQHSILEQPFTSWFQISNI